MLQFRLRTLFITTTASAVMFWVLFVPPQWLGLLAIYLVYFLLPSLTVSGIVFHRGYLQAFFIGMAPWMVLVSVSFATFFFQMWWASPFQLFDEILVGSDSGTIIFKKLYLAVTLVIATASGLIAVGIRRWTLWLDRPND